MRLISNRQRSLVFYHTPPSLTQEWDMIALILEANPIISERIWADLQQNKTGKTKKSVGAKGMTAEQVTRFAIVKMKEQLSYRNLYNRVADSIAVRAFCLVGSENVPKFTTLQENIKQIRPETWKAVNDTIIAYACTQGVEDGRQVRIDTTAVESNIHHPTDSHQLWDCVRVLTRILQWIETDIERLRGRFHDHRNVAHRMFYKIHNTRGLDKQKPLYKKLIKATKQSVAYARQALTDLEPRQCISLEEQLVAAKYIVELEKFLPLAARVIDQAHRRVFLDEQVPAQDKVLSIFESHTDIIKKGQREIVYGHKVLLSGGKSNLILDCVIERGNPADAPQFIPALKRHKQQYGQTPHKTATDAGFASKSNAREALALGVKDVAFVAPTHKSIPEVTQNTRAHKQLRKWRAGIEGVISATKRAFGLDRCTWSGFESFKAYVQLAVLAYNLQTLARHLLVA